VCVFLCVQCSVQLHRLLIQSQLSPCFHVNSAAYFGHTGASLGVYDGLHKMLYCVVLPMRAVVRKVCYLNQIGTRQNLMYKMIYIFN
jgi:hypothetical protein